MNSNQENAKKIFLTHKRFLFNKSLADVQFQILKQDPQFDIEKLEQVLFEDEKLMIKYKKYLQLIKRLVLYLILFIISLVALFLQYKMAYFFIALFAYLSISSFFGIITNRITKTQKNYLLNRYL